jgi:hypothetical protein
MHATKYGAVLIVAVLALSAAAIAHAGAAGERGEGGAEKPSMGVSSPTEQAAAVDPAPGGSLVDPGKILSGGPPKDGIPSIDKPKFVAVEAADEWLAEDELVLALIHKGVKRVYPFQILVWHEIVNDTVAGDPILVTYCPLCGSGIAYERVVDGEAVKFGTTGKLYNSNLVMYDRKTETWWTQIDGKAIVGALAGRELQAISIDTVTWGRWKEVHPDSQVLDRDTGFSRPYGRDPYGTYYTDGSLMFPVENEDPRVHPKTVVFGIEVEGLYKAYREEDLKAASVIEDTVGKVPIRLSRDDAGVVKVEDRRTGREIVKERDFWFAWYAFHPETLLYEP